MKQSLFENRHKAEWEQFSLMLEQAGAWQESRRGPPISQAIIDACAITWRWPGSVVTAVS